MKKKPLRKATAKRPVRKIRKNGHYIEFFGIGIGMLIGAFAIAGFYTADRPYVLGTSIFQEQDSSVLGEADNSENESSDSELEVENKQDEEHNILIQPSQKPNSLETSKQKIPPDTIVDCVSPHGQHVRQSFQACAALNKASNQSKFNFTVLKSTGKDKKLHMPPPERIVPSGVHLDSNQDEEVSKSGKKHLQKEKEQDNIHTSFPLSIDPQTHKLTVTTPTGKKEVTVLPNAAVERVLQNHILSAVENQASSSAANGEDAISQTILTELNNKPVFKVKGFSNKKVFGLFPASFAKTVYVSAEDGSVVKSDQTFFSKLLETVSF